METIGFIFVAGALIGYCILREIQWQSATEKRENAWHEREEKLLDRIQAPEIAVVADQEPTGYVAPDDDEAFWQASQEREES